MFSVEIVLLGLALAIDAAVASFAVGIVSLDVPSQHKVGRGVAVATVFGVFQFLMLWVGSFGGYMFSFSAYGHLFHIVVGLIFFVIASKLFQESFSSEQKEFKWGFGSLLIVGIATSIDALAAGISFGTLPDAHIAALEIGIITAGLCALFYTLSQFLQQIPHRWLLRFASSIFFILVFKVIYDFRGSL